MTLEQSLSAYRRLDPAGWVSLYRHLPWWVGLLAAGLGVALLLFGGGKAFRLVAGPLGAAAGRLWAPVLVSKLGGVASEAQVGMVAGGALATAGFVFPVSALFFAFGLPAGLMAGDLAGSADWLLGFVPGFLLAGSLAVTAHRELTAVATSISGAWLLVLGALAALHPAGSLAESVAQRPLGVVAAAGLLALAGSAYQLALRPSPEQVERRKVEKARLNRERDEKRALEKRWASYSDHQKK